MEIRIRLDGQDPPEGFVVLEPEGRLGSDGSDRTEIPFAGWLGLLRALSDALSAWNRAEPTT